MRRIITLFAFVFIVGLLCMPYTLAAVRVDGENGVNDTAHNGSSWTLAKKTIQAGITAALNNNDSEVWVRGKSGTFSGIYTGQVTMNEGVSIYGGFAGTETGPITRSSYPPSPTDSNRTIITSDDSSVSAVFVSSGITSATVIDGFTIKNSLRGIDCTASSPTITHNIIEYNALGVYTSSGHPTINYNRIWQNNGYGVVCGSYCIVPPIVSNNIISGNKGSGIYATSATEIKNNIISGNSDGMGAGIICSGSSTVINNTIVSNCADESSSGGGGIWASGNATISNNVVAYNTSGIKKYSGSPTLSHNFVAQNVNYNYSSGLSAGNGDITDLPNAPADPGLVDVDYCNLHILSGSGCIGNGDPNAGTGDLDIDGETRASGSSVDIGADQYYSTNPHNQLGPYFTAMVSTTGSDSNDGLSWSSPKATIQSAIDLAVEQGGGDVYVAEGTYSDGNISLPAYLRLCGGWYYDSNSQTWNRDWRNHHSTIDTLQGGINVYWSGHMVSSIDGFTITGSVNNLGGGINCTQSSSDIVNNIIEYCGGGIFCGYGSASNISNNIIRNNTWISSDKSADEGYVGGGGIRCWYSNPAISNNLIASNTGGAVALWDGGSLNCVLTNNTVVGNYDSRGYSGIYCYNSPAFIFNNIIANNSGYGLYTDSSVALNNNDFNGNTTAYYPSSIWNSTNITDPPGFVSGSYHLQSTSPCIDAGYDSAVGSGSLDIDCEPRQIDIDVKGATGVKVDIGADEYYPDYTYSPMVDQGLPSDNLNNGLDRCNIRWANSTVLTIGYGDDFTLPSGPNWTVYKVVVWTVPDVPAWQPYYMGDLYQSVTLYGGAVGGSLSNICSGIFSTGSNATGNSNISINTSDYTGSVKYLAADGLSQQMWKVEFNNLTWQVVGGASYVFGVLGVPRVDRLWFNHATHYSAKGDGYVREFNTTNLASTSLVSGSGWFGGNGSDINVQIFARPQ